MLRMYDYKCLDCNCTFETLVDEQQKFVACPQCFGTYTQKQVSSPSIKVTGVGTCDTKMRV